MRELELEPCQPRPRPVTTLRDEHASATPDLVNQVFDDVVPGRTLVGDITYIRTWEGFCYLATVLDCCTKMVLGYAVADHYARGPGDRRDPDGRAQPRPAPRRDLPRRQG
jgi:transposase InsO family protein